MSSKEKAKIIVFKGCQFFSLVIDSNKKHVKNRLQFLLTMFALFNPTSKISTELFPLPRARTRWTGTRSWSWRGAACTPWRATSSTLAVSTSSESQVKKSAKKVTHKKETFTEMAFLAVVSGHKLDSSQTQVFVRFSILSFLFYKMLFMNRVKYSCFADFFKGFLKPEKSIVFVEIRQ